MTPCTARTAGWHRLTPRSPPVGPWGPVKSVELGPSSAGGDRLSSMSACCCHTTCSRRRRGLPQAKRSAPSAELPHRRYSDTLRERPSTRGSPSTYELSTASRPLLDARRGSPSTYLEPTRPNPKPGANWTRRSRRDVVRQRPIKLCGPLPSVGAARFSTRDWLQPDPRFLSVRPQTIPPTRSRVTFSARHRAPMIPAQLVPPGTGGNTDTSEVRESRCSESLRASGLVLPSFLGHLVI
jgi:hypothetical protein